MKRILPIFLSGLCLVTNISFADVIVSMSSVNENKNVGTVTFKDSVHGVLIEPHLHDLTPGLHGLHLHQNPSCGDKGMAAGGHFDPEQTGKHLGPYNDMGHLGDLPVLYVGNDGVADVVTLAPRLKLSDLQGHSLMIHDHGDNYSDQPQPLGGGMARVVCGVVQSP